MISPIKVARKFNLLIIIKIIIIIGIFVYYYYYLLTRIYTSIYIYSHRIYIIIYNIIIIGVESNRMNYIHIYHQYIQLYP